MKNVYLDHAATTAPDSDILETMYPYLEQHFGNAHSPHKYGRKANGAVESARSAIADALGCEPSEIIFTSGGTESNNAIIKGVAQRSERYSERSKIVSSSAYVPCYYRPMKMVPSLRNRLRKLLLMIQPLSPLCM